VAERADRVGQERLEIRQQAARSIEAGAVPDEAVWIDLVAPTVSEIR